MSSSMNDDDDAAGLGRTKGHAAAPTVTEQVPADSPAGSESCDPERQPIIHGGVLVDDHDGDLVTAAENTDLKRGLGERHLTMLGIAGAIGTGLFLSLGGAIQTGGPLGALLGYAMVGGIVCAVQFALGEVTALLPVSK